MTLEELVQLPEPLALQRHFDDKNYRVFRFLLFLGAICTLVGIGTSIDLKRPATLVVYFLDLLFCGVLFALRRDRVFERNFRQVLIAFLIVQILVLKMATLRADGEDAIGPFFMLMFILLAVRVRVAEHVVLFGAVWVAGILPGQWIGATSKGPSLSTMAAPLTTLAVLLCVVALAFDHFERRRFLKGWQREASRYRERQRMREEIDTARRIQLSMLPQGPPAVDWLDLAAASIPAAEVGGDYYDYFRLDDDRVVLVVADVAGHGVASGLLLSGIRSCLYLLEAELGAPEQVFERLNHMVRRTTDRRTYVTLLCAVLDRAAGTLSVINAGHPPLLHCQGHGATGGELDLAGTSPPLPRPVEIGNGSPPLGTGLVWTYQLDRTTLRSGDLLVLYSDGIIEARNAAGNDYGSERLTRVVQRALRSNSVRDIRDSVLADFSHFRGDEEQDDDLTLVVARVR